MARRLFRAIVAPLAALPGLCAGALDDIGNTGPWAELRPRWNHIEESDRPETTSGGTVRLTAGWRWDLRGRLGLTLEAIHTGHFGRKRFNDDPASFATSPYPLLPDPRHTGVNRAYVTWRGIDDLEVTLGRQRVTLDSERWVSDNDFRQIPQLFDGVSVVHTGFERVALTAGHYRRIRSTSGEVEDAVLTLLHAAWNPAAGHSVSAFGVFHDQAQTPHFTGFADNSYRAMGVRAQGVAARWGSLDLTYVAELARQRPHAGGSHLIDARYWRAGAGLANGSWTLRFDQEVRASNAGLYGLQMPLTDFYSYNGWTLHYFTVPREGLRDRWATARWGSGAVTLYGEVHRFRSDFGGLDLGGEVDVGVTWEIVPRTLVRLQHARYDPGSGRPDPEIRKTWLTLTYAFR